MKPFSQTLITCIIIIFLLVHIIEHYFQFYMFYYLRNMIQANYLDRDVKGEDKKK